CNAWGKRAQDPEEVGEVALLDGEKARSLPEGPDLNRKTGRQEEKINDLLVFPSSCEHLRGPSGHSQKLAGGAGAILGEGRKGIGGAGAGLGDRQARSGGAGQLVAKRRTRSDLSVLGLVAAVAASAARIGLGLAGTPGGGAHPLGQRGLPGQAEEADQEGSDA